MEIAAGRGSTTTSSRFLWRSIDEHVGVWTPLGVPEDDVREAAGFAMAQRAART